MLDILAGQNGRFLLKLAAYFVGFGLLLFGTFSYVPMLLETDQGGVPPDEITQTLIEGLLEASGRRPSFVCTVALMVPITWTYMYTHQKTYGRNLIASLMVLPICATATVWLIQDSLPLAFGLAALVAAVRFRIRLENELDGVYIFASISVGLASGVGHFGVGFVMAAFFCFCSSVIWMAGYGKRPRIETTVDAGVTIPAAVSGEPASGSSRQ
jgi:hypothetical protein